MKQKLHLKPILAILLITLFSLKGFAQNDYNVKLIQSKEESVKIELQLKDYKKSSLKINNNDYTSLIVKDAARILQKGAPSLPKMAQSIIIPDKGSMIVKIVDVEFEEIDNILIEPSKGNIYRNQDPENIPYSFGPEYQKDEFYPGLLSDMDNPYILRDFRGQVVQFYPFQYNPVLKKLRVYTRIVVEVTKDQNSKLSFNELERNSGKAKRNSEFHEIYQSQFLNYTSDSKYSVIPDEGNMLIVCAHEYLSAMDDFVNWKIQRGLDVELVDFDDVGTTADDLKYYVSNYYTNNGLTFLLLVGDGEDIPSLYKSGDSDAAYGHITGSDSYAEVFVGRFSAGSLSDVATQVERTIHYEKNVTSSENWMEFAAGLASDEGGYGAGDDGEADTTHMENIRTDLLAYGYSSVAQIYDPGATPTDVFNAMSSGMGLMNYVGHGSDYEWVTSGFSIDDVNVLTNENKLPFIFDVACVNGNFHGQTCFAEAWLRATNSGNPTGAVAMIASTINQSWDPPMDGQDEMVDILVESYVGNIKRTFGGITINGCMHMNDEYGDAGAEMTDTWTIFGDPSLLVRTKSPDAMSLSMPEAILIGSGSAKFTGDNGVQVSLSRNNELLGTGVISSNSVSIDYTGVNNYDPILITATGYNKVTQVTTLPVFSDTVIFFVHDGTDSIPGAIVEIDGLDKVTDSTGRVRFLVEEGINKAYKVRKIGFANFSGTIDVDTTVIDTVTMVAGSASFKVTFDVKEDNSPLSGVSVSFNGEVKSTDTKGIVYFDDVNPLDDIKYLAEKNLYDSDSGYVDVVDSNMYVNVGMQLSRYDVKFTVTDGTNPIESAEIQFYDQLLTTDAGGEATFLGLLPKNDISYSISKIKYNVANGQLSIVNNNVTQNIELTLSRYNVIFNVTSDIEEDGFEAQVIFDGETKTTSKGKVSFENNLYKENVNYSVSSDGYITSEETVDVVKDQTYNIQLDKKRYNVYFNITDGASSPLNGASVTFDESTKSSDSSGEIVFEDCLPGEAKPYTIAKTGYKSVSGDLNIINSNVTEDIILQLLTGVDDINEIGIEIFPNPSNGTFKISGNNIANSKITIRDLTGRVILEKNLTSQENLIQLNGKKGMFVIEVECNGERTINKLIIE